MTITHEAEAIRHEIEELLADQSTIVLSTVGADGCPRATPLFYLAGSALELYWFSSASSVHSRNLDHEPRVSVAVHVPTDSWKAIRGVQMEGPAARITDRTLRRELSRKYCERFRLGHIARLALGRSTLYVFRPSWLRYTDNTRRFGFKFEMNL